MGRLFQTGTISGLLVLTGAVVAQAGALEDGVAAYNKGDAATALKLWQPLAEAGNAEAQVDLGVLYARGEGVTQDFAAALAWYRKAADQNDVYAVNNIGLMYMRGQGMARDDAAAARFYERAADLKFAPAQYNLGTMYAQGRGVVRDDVEAYKWVRLAMDNYAPEDADQQAEANAVLARLARRMNPADVDQAESLAAQWMPPAPNPKRK